MIKELEFAKEKLEKNEYTCFMTNGQTNIFSRDRGVKPLIKWYEENNDYSSFVAADKVVGKGAAFLYALMNVRAVYAVVLSKSAKEVLEENKIEVYCKKMVEAIRNRDNTGFCPIESALKGIKDKKEALPVIKETLERLK